MKVAIIGGLDIGKLAWDLKRAFEKYLGWEVVNIAWEKTYLDAPGTIDILVSEPPTQFRLGGLQRAMLAMQDQDFFILRWLGQEQMAQLGLFQLLRRNNFCIKLHGTEGRIGLWLYWFYPLLQMDPFIVTSFDYSLYESVRRMGLRNACHIGHALHLDTDFPQPNPNPEYVTVVHAPTDRSKKDTDYFLDVMKRVEERNAKVKTLLIEGKSREECLKLKATANITFDQATSHLGIGTFGRSALEGMALSQPVIAQTNAWSMSLYPDLADILVQTDRLHLQESIESLVNNPDRVKELGAKSRAFVENHFSAPVTARRWKFLIEHIMST